MWRIGGLSALLRWQGWALLGVRPLVEPAIHNVFILGTGLSVSLPGGTCCCRDTGVGMTKEELLSSLGTIARSGTAKFMEQMKEAQDANLIGQVWGFPSHFIGNV